MIFFMHDLKIVNNVKKKFSNISLQQNACLWYRNVANMCLILCAQTRFLNICQICIRNETRLDSKYLKVVFTSDLEEWGILSFRERLKKYFKKALCKVWLKRQITPLGSVAILKSLILFKIIHLWILLPNPPDSLVEALQKTVLQFV